MLPTINGQTETRIHNIQLRIDTQRRGKKHRPVGGVSVEKEPVVKIPLAGSQSHLAPVSDEADNHQRASA